MSQAAAFHHTIPPPHQQILPATTSTSMHHPEGQHHIQPYAHVHPLLSHQQVLPLVGVQGQEHNMHPHGSDENQQYPSYYANNLSDHHPLQIQQPQQVALYAPNFGNTTTASNLIIPSRPERNSSNTGRTINHSTATVAAQQSRSSFSASAVPPFHHYQQQQQRTPKQKRFYSSDLSKAQFQNKNGILGQNRFNNNNNEPSPFRYNPNRRSSIISNTSNTSEQKNSSSRFNTDNRSRQSISDSRKVNAKETENNVFESASGTSIHEENDWNRVGFDEVAYESVKHSDAEGRGTRDVERHEGGIETTQVYSSISEDPALFSQRTQNQDLHLQQQQQQLHTTLYQPCINPSCSNRFHYTQQVYQPIPSTLDSITSSSSPNYMTLVEIPGIIQAPAWCELKPCGCTICRECFTLVIATCEISIPPSFIDFHTDRPSLDKMSINDRPIRGTTSHDILQAQKKFSCVVCMADCSEFGPINGELQNAVQGAETGTINEDVNASNYDDTLRQDELNKVNFSNIERSNDFDGFQSAQDVALGKTKQRLNNLDHVENAIEEGLSCSSTIISPLLQAEQLADAINRRAKSDSAISVQNSPLFGANNSENDLNATSSSEIKDLTNSIISLQFPTLIRVEEEDKDDNDLTIPSRKVSSSNTATSVNTMSTDIRESPQVYSTPDFAGWSTSSASAASNSSAPSSPITMQSPTFEIRSEGIVMKDAPWRQKALPENHHLIQNIPRVFEDDKILESKTSFSRDSTHQEAKKMHVHVGLGLSFDSMAFVPAPPGAQAEETGVKPHTQSNANSSGNSRPLSPEGSMTRPKRRIPKAKAKEFAGSAASTVAPSVPVDVEKRDQRDNERQTPATPQRSFHSDAPTTPTRALRGRGRGRADSTRGGVTGTGRGRGGYIAAHQARMAEVAHQSSPTRPSGHASFSPIHSRTSTQSSIHTTNTTSVSSSGGTSSPRFFKTYGGRKVSEVENRLSVLPDYLANPTHEQISIWDENKSRWWIDPWLGKPMGVCERIIDGKNIMCGSDGEPLMKGKAAGISWPILKVCLQHLLICSFTLSYRRYL